METTADYDSHEKRRIFIKGLANPTIRLQLSGHRINDIEELANIAESISHHAPGTPGFENRNHYQQSIYHTPPSITGHSSIQDTPPLHNSNSNTEFSKEFSKLEQQLSKLLESQQQIEARMNQVSSSNRQDNNRSFRNNNPVQTQQFRKPNIICRYCKIPGHTLEVCRKREATMQCQSDNYRPNNNSDFQNRNNFRGYNQNFSREDTNFGRSHNNQYSNSHNSRNDNFNNQNQNRSPPHNQNFSRDDTNFGRSHNNQYSNSHNNRNDNFNNQNRNRSPPRTSHNNSQQDQDLARQFGNLQISNENNNQGGLRPTVPAYHHLAENHNGSGMQ